MGATRYNDGRYRRFPDWLLDMDRLPSYPDLVLLEGTEQGPRGRVYNIDKDARLHLVESHSRLTLPRWTGQLLRQRSMKDFADAWPMQGGQM